MGLGANNNNLIEMEGFPEKLGLGPCVDFKIGILPF